MQNFTLGKKGYAMLLFALILLIGSSPTYGQCPVPADDNAATAGNQQSFCALATVSELEIDDFDGVDPDNVRWYRNATSNTAIPDNEILRTQRYFAGNGSNTCTARQFVDVTVDDIGPPTADFGNTFAPCEYSTSDNSTVQDLIESVVGEDIRIYEEEFTGDALNPNELLVEGRSYFADQKNPDTDCRSSRLALRYEPVLAEAPTAEPVQTFCPGATVADLEAEATSANTTAFRWYSTATSNPQLPSSTPLINGETYYASQIVNRENSPLPPCESIDRAEVTVVFQAVTPLESTQVFCVDPDDASTNPRVEDLVSPYGTRFFADANFTQLLAPQVLLVDNEDYFTANGDPDTCEATRVVVDLVEIPNAGDDVNETVCETELNNPADLIAQFNALLVGRDLGGTFSDDTIAELTAQFTSNPIGVFTTTYTVDNGSCTDSAQITVTVIEATPAEAGDDQELAFCSTDGIQNLFDFLSADANPNGTFTFDSNGNEVPSGNFDPASFGGQTVEITYTVDGDTPPCTVGSDTAGFEIEVTQAEPANAGGPVTATYCENEDEDVTLVSLLDSDANTTGSFSAPFESGIFNPADQGTGTYTITYSLDESEDCVTGIDETTITITVREIEEADAGEPVVASFCVTETQDVQLTSLLADGVNTLGAFDAPFEDGIFNPASAGVGV
ncbi:immunoglobulin domain-containing protein, partial [Gillisia marina]|uniref:immunoglobulin domain-containing protein n=1 Tax=Gillisia marina TaxID=1167637 RepID=UPI000299D942